MSVWSAPLGSGGRGGLGRHCTMDGRKAKAPTATTNARAVKANQRKRRQRPLRSSRRLRFRLGAVRHRLAGAQGVDRELEVGEARMRATVPAGQVDRVDRAVPDRWLGGAGQHRHQDAALQPLMSLVAHPSRPARHCRPDHHHRLGLGELGRDQLGEVLARQDLPVPPHAPPTGLQPMREPRRERAVLAGVADEHVGHGACLTSARLCVLSLRGASVRGNEQLSTGEGGTSPCRSPRSTARPPMPGRRKRSPWARPGSGSSGPPPSSCGRSPPRSGRSSAPPRSARIWAPTHAATTRPCASRAGCSGRRPPPICASWLPPC